MKRTTLFVTLLACLCFLNQCARNPVSGKRQVVLMSEAQEIAMGKEADPQIVAQYGLYEDSALQRFIRAKGQAMAVISHRPNINYEFKILDSEVLNAFATPGGYVYFTRGIMAYMNNEAEFAGVLGHELGHIAARHGVEQQRNATLGQIGLIAGIIVAPNLARFAESASQGLGLLLLKFGRDAEREADKLGVEYSSKIGYDATKMAEFFHTLERQGEQTGSSELPTFLSTHPDQGERFTNVSKMAAEWRQKLNQANTQVNRDAYLRRIEGLIYGEDPRGGYLENNVFYHPVLRFQFATPVNWAYQNTPQRVQMAPKDGKALMFLTLAQGKSIGEAATAMVQQNNLQVVDSRELTVNGLRALSLVADLKQDPQQQQQAPVRTLSYLIQYGESIYHIMGVSLASDFSAYAPYFSRTMESFRELSDPAKLNKKPERVRIKTVKQAGSLSQALRSYNVTDKRLEELALLNGMQLTDPVTAGMLIKVLEE
jgi:predicted Zn-dependent protease